MRPQMVMLEVRPLDARKQPLKPEYKFPYIEIDNMVFLRVPDDKWKALDDGSKAAFIDTITKAVAHSGTAFVPVPDTVALLDRVLQEIQETKPEDFKQSDVMVKLSVFRDAILKNNITTNKTFLVLPEAVRFLEIKEKWETIPDREPTPKI